MLKNNWNDIIIYFNYAPEYMCVYVANAIESFNRQLRKETKTIAGFHSDEEHNHHSSGKLPRLGF